MSQFCHLQKIPHFFLRFNPLPITYSQHPHFHKQWNFQFQFQERISTRNQTRNPELNNQIICKWCGPTEIFWLFCTDFIKYVNQINQTRTCKIQKILFPAVFPLGTDCVWAWVNAMFKKAVQWPTRGERSSVSHVSLIKKAEEQTIWAGRVVTVVLKSSRQLLKVQYKKGIVTPPSILLSLSHTGQVRVQHYSQNTQKTKPHNAF